MRVSDTRYQPPITQKLEKVLFKDDYVKRLIIKFKRSELKQEQRSWEHWSFFEEVERLMRWELRECPPRTHQQIISFKQFYELINTFKNPHHINWPDKGSMHERLEKLVGKTPPFKEQT